MWSFGNGLARDFIIFGVDNTISSHSDNQTNNFLVLGEGPTEGIKNTVDAAEKSKDKILFEFALQWC